MSEYMSGLSRLGSGLSEQSFSNGTLPTQRRPLSHWVTVSIPLMASLMALALVRGRELEFWGLFVLVAYSLVSTVRIEGHIRQRRSEAAPKEAPVVQVESTMRKKKKN